MILIIFLFGFGMGMIFYFILMWGWDLFFPDKTLIRFKDGVNDEEILKMAEDIKHFRDAHGPLRTTYL